MSVPLNGDLNRLVRWTDVVSELGIADYKKYIPQKIECPFCTFGYDSLTIYQDYTLDVEWYHCRKCNWSGDSVELLAKAKDTTVDYVLLSMKRISDYSDERLAKYKKTLQIYDAVKWMWNRAKDNYPFADKKIVRKLLSKFSLNLSNTDRERWLGRTGRFVGGCHKSDIDDIQRTMDKVFIGNHWTDILIIPFYDLPGRLSGFYIVGRDGGGDDRTFAFVKNAVENRDVGLGMLDVLSSKTYDIWAKYDRPGKRGVVVMLDPVMALQLHAHHFKDNSLPLPLLACHSVGKVTTNIWQSVPMPDKIFVGSVDQAVEVYSQARKADGYVGELWSSDNPHKNRAPSEILRLLSQEAKHWREALEHFVVKSSIARVEEMMLLIGMNKEEQHQFADECQPKAKLKLKEVLKEREPIRYVTVGNNKIIETKEGWIDEKNRNLVSDAILRIDETIHTPGQKKSIYVGRVIYKGEEIPYVVSDDTMLNPNKWIRKLLVDKGKGVTIFNSSWSKNMVSIATQFNKPKSKVEARQFGWSINESAFIFPKFKINSLGQIYVNNYPEVKDRLMPANKIPLPSDIWVKDLLELDEFKYVNKVTWALIFAVVRNILAPVFNVNTKGICIHGKKISELAEKIAFNLGCVKHNMSSLHVFDKRVNSVKIASEAEFTYNWPVIVDCGADRKPLIEWLGVEKHNCIVAVNKKEMDVLKIYKNWIYIEDEEDNTETTGVLSCVEILIPLYLKDLCTRNMVFVEDKKDFDLNIYVDIEKWFLKQIRDEEDYKYYTNGGFSEFRNKYGGFNAAFDFLNFSVQNRGYYFLKLIEHLYCTGELPVQEYLESRWSTFRLIKSVDEKTQEPLICIPESSVNKLFYSTGRPPLNYEDVCQALKDYYGQSIKHEIKQKIRDEDVWAITEKDWKYELGETTDG